MSAKCPCRLKPPCFLHQKIRTSASEDLLVRKMSVPLPTADVFYRQLLVEFNIGTVICGLCKLTF